MSGYATAPNARGVAAAEKEAAALQLKVSGATYEQIARHFGMHDRSGARKIVRRALARIPGETADELRQLITLRHEELYRETIRILRTHHPARGAGGVIVRDANGNEIEDDDIKLRAMAVALRNMEQMCRLLGLEAPQQVEHSGPDGEPIPVEVRQAELVSQLVEFRRKSGLAALPAAGETA